MVLASQSVSTVFQRTETCIYNYKRQLHASRKQPLMPWRHATDNGKPFRIKDEPTVYHAEKTEGGNSSKD